MEYRKKIRWTGWLMGVVATTIYMLTLEPNVSFWDCGEFITTSYGLEVGHPPGAPFYQLLAHIFTWLSLGDVRWIAYCSNALSAVAGGVAVMMLFWSIEMLLRGRSHAILGAIVGSSCYMLCDTAWFSAVESEVYSLSMAISSVVIWAMLRWHYEEDRSRAGRWLLLIALMLGLGVCVHELTLLVTPMLLLIFILSKKKEWKQLWKILPLAVLLFAVGLSPYLIIPIRAKANPPINSGHPSTAANFKRYIQRTQYEKAPLWPRMWRHREHDQEYARMWTRSGSNLEYYASYQLWYMYGRYLMWNFGGRYNDRQGYGTMMNGQCITGIPFIDKALVGTGAKMPDTLPGGHHRYFLLPLLLGLIGLLGHRSHSKRGFWTVMTLFLMGGVILNLYLNHPCYEPRERDYAYVLSFYAFCMWIGVGATLLADDWSKYSEKWKIGEKRIVRWAPVILLGVPLLMGCQNWNDHDRSHRYIALDTAHNILDNCAEGAILFTAGDNDTFPLWYAQNVEGYRTDVTTRNILLMGGTRKMLEMIEDNQFERPVYLSHYAYNDTKEIFAGHLGMVGFGYRLLPDTCDSVLADEAYRNVMRHLKWHDMNKAYVDEVSCRFLEQYWRDMLVIGRDLTGKGRTTEARNVIEKTLDEIPLAKIQDARIGYQVVEALQQTHSERTEETKAYVVSRLEKELDYYGTISPARLRFIGYTLSPRMEAYGLLKAVK